MLNLASRLSAIASTMSRGKIYAYER